jgi:hypothetical protein
MVEFIKDKSKTQIRAKELLENFYRVSRNQELL